MLLVSLSFLFSAYAIQFTHAAEENSLASLCAFKKVEGENCLRGLITNDEELDEYQIPYYGYFDVDADLAQLQEREKLSLEEILQGLNKLTQRVGFSIDNLIVEGEVYDGSSYINLFDAERRFLAQVLLPTHIDLVAFDALLGSTHFGRISLSHIDAEIKIDMYPRN